MLSSLDVGTLSTSHLSPTFTSFGLFGCWLGMFFSHLLPSQFPIFGASHGYQDSKVTLFMITPSSVLTGGGYLFLTFLGSKNVPRPLNFFKNEKLINSSKKNEVFTGFI